ncbi:ABC transporter permease [Ornithinibacillus scapharcae]|uniref:ABC transporter permease n=1 Tax=Ornithinibacillus scapharcae TaxID=1147159 RepID=UPI000225B579|nr:ABC transporter permease subunit [Ornithinibacillus scapharcae]
MFRLMLFEFKKIGRSNFARILIVALILFCIGFYAFTYVNTTRIEDEIQSIQSTIQFTEQDLNKQRETLKTAEGAEATELKNNITFYEEWLVGEQNKLELYNDENWQAILQQEIDEAEADAGSMRYNGQTHTFSHPTLFTLDTYVAISKWMQNNEITPLLPVDRHFSYVTLYDKEVISTSPAEAEMIMETFRKNSIKYSSSSIHYLYRLFEISFGFVGVIFFLFLFGDIVTKEGLGRNGPIHLLRTQPIHRDKILASKFLTTIVFSSITLISIIAFSIIVGGLFDRIGDWDYPVLIYGEERTFTLMGMGTFLLKASSLFLLILIFCYSILILFSILTKRSLITTGLTLGILLIGIGMSKELVTSTIAHYIPFQYFSVFNVLTNELALTMENFNISYVNGMVSLSISSVALLLITYIISVIQYRKSN